MTPNLALSLGTLAGVLQAPPSGLELGAESLKFATGNLQVANQTSVLKQSTTNLTDVMTADSSGMFFRVYMDFDRMHLNNPFLLFGNATNVSSVGRLRISFFPQASATTANRRRFLVQMRRGSGDAYSFLGGEMPAVSGWYDLHIRRATGGVFRCDVFNMAGTNVADGTATALTQTLGGVNIFNQSHVYIGDAQDVANEATTATVRGTNNATGVGWDGAIAFIGIYDGFALSDANCQAIALGADPFALIGASNFKLARRFSWASGAPAGLSPVAGTADTTSATTVIGTFLPGGTPGRQDTTDYITLDAVPDYTLFGVDPATGIATVPFAGTCGGVAFSGTITQAGRPAITDRREVRFSGGQVQGRFISEAGAPTGAWQTVAATAATGVTTGRTFTENSRTAAGVKILINGQSQMTIFSNGTVLGITNTDPIISIARYERATASPNPVALQLRADFGGLRVSDGIVTMSQGILAKSGMCSQIVLNALEGTGALDMIADWSRTAGGVTVDTEDLLAYAGDDITVDLWQWFTTDQAAGADFDSLILDAVYNGTGPNATANKLPDIRSAQAVIAISPATRQTPTSAGPLDADPNQTIGAIRPSQKSWADANGAVFGPYITDMRVTPIDGPHQVTDSLRGNPRIGVRLAETVNRAVGASTLQDPTIGTPVFAPGKASFSLTVTLPNAGSTLRVDDTATFGSNVQGFEISTDGGTTWSRSGFTATFDDVTNIVTVTKSPGDWSAVSAGQFLVRYATGSPFGYGTSVESSELFRGGLYDGTALEGGLGLPVAPLAATVVAET